jgi:hypothetical protein
LCKKRGRGLTSNSVVKSLLGQMASLVRSVENLIVKDREIESKAETDGMGRSKISLSNLSGGLVCLQRLVSRCLTLVTDCEFGKVAVVIALPVKRISLDRVRYVSRTNILW